MFHCKSRAFYMVESGFVDNELIKNVDGYIFGIQLIDNSVKIKKK